MGNDVELVEQKGVGPRQMHYPQALLVRQKWVHPRFLCLIPAPVKEVSTMCLGKCLLGLHAHFPKGHPFSKPNATYALIGNHLPLWTYESYIMIRNYCQVERIYEVKELYSIQKLQITPLTRCRTWSFYDGTQDESLYTSNYNRHCP
jgi:hypothetical protein